MFEWNEVKRAANFAKHGVDFAAAERLDWTAALTVEDARGEYGELRFISILPLSGRLHVCVWTQRGEARRIISLRKANTKEAMLHARSQELH